jgi:SWI/SNF-related matrix-associated actin-dependent regulator 1 of chromatin subfamily A
MRLTFEQNQFVIRDTSQSNVKNWIKNYADNSYRTTDISEAVRFREYADSKALNIFNKLMLKKMPLPLHGLLIPNDVELYPFQKDLGVPFILKHNRSYIAHEPGLGKSAQFITAVNSRDTTADIIVPSFLKITWARQITKFSYRDFPEIEIVKDSDHKEKTNWGAQYLICSDAMLLRDWVRKGLTERNARMKGIDEGHRFKNHESSRTVALYGGTTKDFKSKGLVHNADHVCVMSGTPMLKRPIELWTTLFSLAPELIDFMSMKDFGFKYCGPWQDDRGHWHFSGASNVKELASKLPKFMQRLKKKDVLKDLPEKVREVIYIDQDTRARDVIEFDRGLVKKFKGTNKKMPDSLGEYAMLRHLTGRAKIKWSAQFVSQYLFNDLSESIILYAWHRDVVEELARILSPFKPEIIMGKVSDSERTRIEDEFQGGKKRLIIGNISAMNLGLTLTKATRVIFCEYDWVFENNKQAEDRANRIGSDWSVFCQYLVLANSFDELMLVSNLEGNDNVENIIDASASF